MPSGKSKSLIKRCNSPENTSITSSESAIFSVEVVSEGVLLEVGTPPKLGTPPIPPAVIPSAAKLCEEETKESIQLLKFGLDETVSLKTVLNSFCVIFFLPLNLEPNLTNIPPVSVSTTDRLWFGNEESNILAAFFGLPMKRTALFFNSNSELKPLVLRVLKIL